MQAYGSGRRDDHQRLAGGVCGKIPGGWHSTPGDWVGSGWDREVIRRRNATDGAEVGWSRVPITIHKRLIQVGR